MCMSKFSVGRRINAIKTNESWSMFWHYCISPVKQNISVCQLLCYVSHEIQPSLSVHLSTACAPGKWIALNQKLSQSDYIIANGKLYLTWLLIIARKQHMCIGFACCIRHTTHSIVLALWLLAGLIHLRNWHLSNWIHSQIAHWQDVARHREREREWKLTCATFSPIFGVCLDPWKYFAEPLSCMNRNNPLIDLVQFRGLCGSVKCFVPPQIGMKILLLFDLIYSRKAHLIMMNYHSGRCYYSPNSVGMVLLCSVANHFRMTHTENTDEPHDPIYLE